ncbi:MAG TPA: AAA family ATPase [Hyphomicrobiaceae bacterium]|nr:AAA family ATPase [Hyphomicrobiaceae bacterium]
MSNQACMPGRDQTEVIAFLANPASYRGVERVDRFETHGNLVFLAGSEAWKIKRAVRFPYMDFSTLEKRRAACLREVEINRGFSDDLYLGCVPITRSSAGALAIAGHGEVVEWAVHMRRFEQSALLSNLAKEGRITDDLAKRLADVVHDCHARAERRAPSSGTAHIRRLIDSVCGSLLSSDALDQEEVADLARRLDDQIDKAAPVLDERASRGFVRRCHGDLHLANVVLWHGSPVLYDAIEFDEAIATIDTLYDLAFLLMDLDWHGQRHAANVVLNRYLWRSQDDLDLEGLAALPLFMALRAGIRAMVAVDRADQENSEARKRDLDRARRYVRAALGYASQPAPQLIAIGGLSGTGKTTLGTALAPLIGGAPGAVHLRSDLERKAAAGVGELDRLPASAYAKEARLRIYQRLREKARMVLAAGRSVVVDAVFAGEGERRDIEAAAAGLDIPFHGLWLEADPETLVARVTARRNDASDATPDTVAAQLGTEVGPMSPAWIAIDAGGTGSETLRLAASRLRLAATQAPGAVP